jgi:hypothetical protein
MSKRIFGDEDTIKRAREENTGTTYINWDAINELPEEYEAIITEIKFDAKNLEKDFSPIDSKGETWMPQPQLMYRIAEACGISGGDNSLVEPLTEEVDINPMLMKPMDAEPTMRKMIVGRSVTKFSERLQEDGTFLRSSPCTITYNAFERCTIMWMEEEKSTNGYSADKVKSWPSGDKYVHVEYTKNGKKESFDAVLKYDTPFKRRAHFYGELKFAHSKAETKAHEKTIRELAGLQTGYKTEMLASGSLIFARIRRSREILKLESAARLGAIGRGEGPMKSGERLFGKASPESTANKMPEEEPDPFAIGTETVDVVPAPEPEKPKPTIRELLITVMEHYQAESLIPKDHIKRCENLLTWLHTNTDAESKKDLWQKAINLLTAVEKTIPEKGRVTHKLY